MTLDEFIAGGSERFPRNAYVREPGFKTLYVRWGWHVIEGDLKVCFDLAAIEARRTGRGSFKKLVGKLRSALPSTPLYVECVLNPRFAEGLLRMGFRVVSEDCFVLDTGETP